MKSPHRRSAVVTALLLAYPAAYLSMSAAHAADAAADAPAQLDTVSVYGRGVARQVETITQSDIAQLPPGSSPLAAVARLPSVNFQSADPFGAYEWSTRITVRGFSQNQLGFTLDDVPLGDMSYGNFNGLHISRAISSENISRTVLSQGAGALETASSGNLGGTLQFFSGDPSDKLGGTVSQTFGSGTDLRTFLRFDSGNTGYGKFYVSYADQSQDKWKGEGQDRSKAFNSKYVYTFGENRFSAFFNTSRREEIDYQDMSKEMIGRLGYNWDNFYPNYAAAIKQSNTYCGNGGSTYTSQCDDAYYAGSGLRNDELGGMTLDAKLSDDARLKTTLYHHHNKGAGLWYTPYVPSPDGTPISIRTTEYDINRSGILSALSYSLGAHQLKAGFWYEDNKFDQARRFYALTATDPGSPYDFPSNPFATQWAFKFDTKTELFFAEDSYQVNDALTLSGGFKSLRSKIDGQLVQGSGLPSGDITASKGFLPQLGLTYALSPQNEAFASVAQNMRAFQGTATGASPYATTIAGFDAIKGSLKPEISTTFETGVRTRGTGYEGVAAVYLVNFKDRLLAVQQGAGIVGAPVALSNVGRVQTAGLELALTTTVAKGWSWYNGASFSSSEYKDNVNGFDSSGNPTVVATSGKKVVDAPDTMLKSIIGYDDSALFGSFGLDYMSKRYYSYLNDASVPSRVLGNLSLGYRFKEKLTFLSEASVQLSVTNLFDKRYIATLGSNGFVNSDPNGTAQTLLPGAPRQSFITFSAKL